MMYQVGGPNIGIHFIFSDNKRQEVSSRLEDDGSSAGGLLVVAGGGNRINKRREYSPLPCTGSRKEDQLSL